MGKTESKGPTAEELLDEVKEEPEAPEAPAKELSESERLENLERAVLALNKKVDLLLDHKHCEKTGETMVRL